MRGGHYLKGWSKTQQCVTLSSAEAELVAMNRATSELLGILSMLTDLGERGRKHLLMERSAGDGAAVAVGSTAAAARSEHDGLIGVVCGDSSAALAISNRKGCGKLRHIHIGELWLQEKVSQGEVQVKKVLGDDNPADLYTKHLVQDKIRKYCGIMNLVLSGGRASAGLHVQHGMALHNSGKAV